MSIFIIYYSEIIPYYRFLHIVCIQDTAIATWTANNDLNTQVGCDLYTKVFY